VPSQDSLLWPVLAATVLSLAAVGAAALVAAVQDRNLYAMAAVALIAGLTVFGLEEPLRRRRLGTLGILVLSLWLLSAVGAVALGQF